LNTHVCLATLLGVCCCLVHLQALIASVVMRMPDII